MLKLLPKHSKENFIQMVDLRIPERTMISNCSLPARTRWPGDVPEGPLKVLTPGTYEGPSRDSQRINTKIDDLMKKLFFRRNSPCITYLFLFFAGRANIQKFLTGTSTGRLRDPVAGTK